jgi:hypothetical protein
MGNSAWPNAINIYIFTHGIILGFVLDRVVHSLIISLAIAENVYGVGVTIVIFSVIQDKHDSLI